MGLSIWNLFKAGLLCTNALMILNRRRVLAKYGFDDVNTMGCDPSQKPLKVQAIGLLQAVQYLKVPVIAANIITILFEIILGGS
mmetsp:Transcript_16246/g.19839  ORF Transcript_16246/g.19839 Transcript_16246/m.19839 type:complete len:84 (+) Transcript_16246:116-367(+)